MATQPGLDEASRGSSSHGLTSPPRIPVAAPVLNGNEAAYVAECLESSWISSVGKYVDAFESSFAAYCGTEHAISCCNGTVALHLALAGLGIGPGDEVVVPTLTFVATANAVAYCGARPVFADVDPHTWNMAPDSLEACITSQTRAVIVVHLFGQPANMDAILAIARRHKLFVIEDAAEAHGAEYTGKKVGSIGDVGTFSFYGNKIVTTGEGGMVVTHDDALASRIRLLRGQGMDPKRRYWFPVVGFNYRLTNVAAAIGVAQMENIEWHLKRRLEVARLYQEMLRPVPGIEFQGSDAGTTHVYWMVSIILAESVSATRDCVMNRLSVCGIETRPVFHPMHRLPPYLCDPGGFPVAERISSRGISLPTWAGLTEGDVRYISDCLRRFIESCKYSPAL
jgi:perosamine synthetase